MSSTNYDNFFLDLSTDHHMLDDEDYDANTELMSIFSCEWLGMDWFEPNLIGMVVRFNREIFYLKDLREGYLGEGLDYLP